MPGRSARELWLVAVKNRAGTMTGANRKSSTHSKKTPSEYWVGSLRKSSGTLEIGATDTFSGSVKRPSADEVAYRSTSHHLREKVGAERPPRRAGSSDPSARPAPGTPAYKSPEEYYDEVLELRRQLAFAEKDSALMRARLLRVEQENQRKDRELEQLLDPSKGDDLRRALSDRRPESSAVVQGMKQRVLKLEQQLKDKETAYNTMKSNIKNTRIEELTLQMEMMYQEIVRLQTLSASTGSATTSSAQGIKESKESSSKVKALNDTILRMNEKNVRLTLENKTLKEDLEKLMAQVAHSKDSVKQGPERQIQDAIVSLENKLSKNGEDAISVGSSQSAFKKHTPIEGKITLEGTLEQRLDTLDKRETALLGDIKKLNEVIKRLKEDRQHYRQKVDERGNEVKSLKKEIDNLTAEIQALHALDRAKTPPAKSPRPSSVRAHDSHDTAEPTSNDRSPLHSGKAERHSDLPASGRSTPRQRNDIGMKQQGESAADKEKEEERQQKIMKFTMDRAAKKLQNNWMQYQQRQHNKAADEAVVVIQSALRGHLARQAILAASEGKNQRSLSAHLDGAAVAIQSAMRAHASRHALLSSPRLASGARLSPSPAGSLSRSPLTAMGRKSPKVDDESDDGIVTPKKASISRSSSRNSVKSPASKRATPPADDDDDDDDIVF